MLRCRARYCTDGAVIGSIDGVSRRGLDGVSPDQQALGFSFHCGRRANWQTASSSPSKA